MSDTPMLVWTEGYSSERNAVASCEAHAPFLGRYSVAPCEGKWLAFLTGVGSSLCGQHPTPEAACAACEADYRERMRKRRAGCRRAMWSGCGKR